jgi:carboxypeptidase PM20D1
MASPSVSESRAGLLLPSPQELAERLGRALQFETISYQDSAEFDPGPFYEIRRYLEASFPRVHAALERECVGRFSLLYTWPGREPGLAPILLLAHLDVVPVEPGTRRHWEHPPFDGIVDGGFIWGRGSLDDKNCVLGLLEAAEALLAAGFSPRRTVMFAFGEDEEVGGNNGAACIAALLQSHGVHPEYVLDEGLAITDGLVANVRRPVALIGIAEKGYLCLALSVEVEGGHSSMPPRETAIGILSAALARLERHPMPARLAGPAALMLANLAGEMPPIPRLLMSNQRLFGPLIARVLARTPSGAAMIRTTTAPTIYQVGVKENVLPAGARAVVNFRLLPGDTIAAVTDRVRRTIADPRVKICECGVMRSEASPVSDTASAGYRAIERTIAAMFPGIAVAPGLVLGGTDSRHYAPLGGPCYRFAPLWMRPEDMSRVHGANERIAVDRYAQLVEFYARLIQATA